MVKVAGPAFSLDASGTLGDAITFSKWKGRPYVRERVIPSNPQSGLQTGYRSMFKFLSQYWDSLSAAEQATYDDLAASLNISPFNAFMRFNQLRWRNFNAPSKETPAAETGTPGTLAAADMDPTAGVSSITLTAELSAVADNWGVAIFRSTTTGFSTALSNCIAIVTAEATGDNYYLDSPLDPGTYYYNSRRITDDGVLSAEGTEGSAVVT